MDARPALHPTDQILHAYGLGKLDDAAAESVNRHLEGCPDCRRRVAAMSSDSFLGRRRDERAHTASFRPAVSSTDGLSLLDRGPAPAAPPPVSSFPPGLADHPDREVIRELGRGGMGVVYLAQNTLMGRPEVLKVVGADLISRPGVLARFLREIRSAARLQHPNIVTAYSAHRLGESLVLAMEYVEGLDLARLVKARGPLPIAHACNFAHQAALGLQHAHEHGMVHRDIKPANLILSRGGRKAIVKVLDFGLAKVTSEGQADSGLTREGQMLGTPDYIAPEQIRDAQSADIRADIYSLGCTLYYLLTGGPPFSGDNLWDLYQAHFSIDAVPPNLARPEVPMELAALVAKMMAKEPARRFQEPKEVAHALAPFFKPATTPPATSGGETTRAHSQVRPTHPTGSSTVRDQPPMSGPPPLPSAVRPSKTGAVGVAWESLIETREHEPPVNTQTTRPAERTPGTTSAPVNRPPWVWPLAAVGVSFLLFAAARMGGVLGVRGPEGTIVVTNVKDADEDPDVLTNHRGDPLARRSDPKKVSRPPRPDVSTRDRTESKIVARSSAANPGLFQPILTADDTTSWLIGDPANTVMEEGTVTLRAGADGNFLITQNDDYVACSITVELAASRGTDAFLVVHAKRRGSKWTAFTSRVFDDGGRIAAGKVEWDFLASENGQRLAFEPGNFFTIQFIAVPPGAFHVRINQQATSTANWVLAERHQRGAAGIVVRSGEVRIRRMIVTDHAARDVARGPVKVPTGAGAVEKGAARNQPTDAAGAPDRVELSAFYHFDDEKASDSSGRGNDGTFGYNAPTPESQGFQGGALRFESRRDTRITVPVNINPSAMPRITMGGWFKADTAGARQGLLSHGDGGFDRSLAIDDRGGGGFRWSAFTGSGVLAGSPVTVGRWTFVAARHDQLTGALILDVDGRRFRADGVRFGEGRRDSTIGRNSSFRPAFDGCIDNVFIYRGMLSDERVQDIRARGGPAILAAHGSPGLSTGSAEP